MGRGGGACNGATVTGEEGAVAAGLAPLEAEGRARPTPLRLLEPLEFEPDMRTCCHIYCLLDISFNITVITPRDGCRRTRFLGDTPSDTCHPVGCASWGREKVDCLKFQIHLQNWET